MMGHRFGGLWHNFHGISGVSQVSVKRVLVVQGWVSPPSNILLSGCNPVCGALSD